MKVPLVYAHPSRRILNRLRKAMHEYRNAEFSQGAPTRAQADEIADAAEMLLLEASPKRRPIRWEEHDADDH